MALVSTTEFSPLSVVSDPDANQFWDCLISEEKLKESMKDLGKPRMKSTRKSKLR
jgi:hypothetical protein